MCQFHTKIKHFKPEYSSNWIITEDSWTSISFLQSSWTQLCRPKALGHFSWTLFYHRLLHFVQNRTKKNIWFFFFFPTYQVTMHRPEDWRKTIQEIFPDYLRKTATPIYRGMQKSSRPLPGWTESSPGPQTRYNFLGLPAILITTLHSPQHPG